MYHKIEKGRRPLPETHQRGRAHVGGVQEAPSEAPAQELRRGEHPVDLQVEAEGAGAEDSGGSFREQQAAEVRHGAGLHKILAFRKGASLPDEDHQHEQEEVSHH